MLRVPDLEARELAGVLAEAVRWGKGGARVNAPIGTANSLLDERRAQQFSDRQHGREPKRMANLFKSL